MRMTSNDVQNIMGVQDRQVIAYGYTFERRTVEIYFDCGQIVRRVDGVDERSSVLFEPNMFILNIKRWYVRGVHHWLRQMFATFSEYGLSLTDGGDEWGYKI